MAWALPAATGDWGMPPSAPGGTVAKFRDCAGWLPISAVYTHFGVGIQAVARLMFLHLFEGIGAVRFAIAADEVILRHKLRSG